MVKIEVEKLNKSFGDSHVIRDLSFKVEPGEFLTILGASGCGKTTTLRLVLGTISPDSGIIRFDGRNVTSVPCRERNVGIVYQDYALFPHMTAFENIAFGLRARGMGDGSMLQLMDTLGIEKLGSKYPRQLSGGEQQRVALARTLVVEPKIILLDEPLSNVDAKLRLDLRNEIRRINREMGLTVLYVTHNQEEALIISDRISIMSEGHIIESGRPKDLFFNPRTEYTREFMSVVLKKIENLKEMGIA